VSNTGNNAAGGTSLIGGILTSIVVPTAVGAVLAGSLLGGLVYSQTQGPDTNPASKDILVYGD
jgi:hypothetical protein